MAGLLVSVRSAEEARLAVEGGTSVVDIKEPERGPLGRADVATWRAVREAVPPTIAVSVALGELRDWELSGAPRAIDFAGIAYRKLGLAGAGPAWESDWRSIRRDGRGGPPWVAVAYLDWSKAEAPDPEAVLAVAIEARDCAGVLLDTWDKSSARPLEASPGWSRWIDRARRGSRFVALAGGLDRASILRLGPLRPDLFAVRGAACAGSDRCGAVDAGRVAELVRAARGACLSTDHHGVK